MARRTNPRPENDNPRPRRERAPWRLGLLVAGLAIIAALIVVAVSFHEGGKPHNSSSAAPNHGNAAGQSGPLTR